MVKLSELKDDVKIIDESGNVYDVEEVKGDLRYFKDEGKKLYTTTEYHAHIDARDMLESAIESEYENKMYEDWNEHILSDITDEDVEKIQAVLDDILSRARGQNTSYFQGEEIEVDIEFEGGCEMFKIGQLVVLKDKGKGRVVGNLANGEYIVKSGKGGQITYFNEDDIEEVVSE